MNPSEYNDKNGYHVIRLAYKSPVKINKTLRHYEGTAEVLEKESPDVIFLHNIFIRRYFDSRRLFEEVSRSESLC